MDLPEVNPAFTCKTCGSSTVVQGTGECYMCKNKSDMINPAELLAGYPENHIREVKPTPQEIAAWNNQKAAVPGQLEDLPT